MHAPHTMSPVAVDLEPVLSEVDVSTHEGEHKVRRYRKFPKHSDGSGLTRETKWIIDVMRMQWP